MVRMRNKITFGTGKIIVALLLALSAWSSVPATTEAAAIELTLPIKSDFDKTVAAADVGTGVKLKQLYPSLQSLLNEDIQLEAQIKALHYDNEEALISLRKTIRDIDSAKLDKLENEVKQIKAKYKPLFDDYTALNKQIAAARALKSKLLNEALRIQANAMKMATQLARDNIRAKEAALKTAKEAAAAKIKAARTTLGETDTIKVQIQAMKSAAALPRKSQSPVWTNFKYAIKKNETRSASDALETLVSLSKQIVEKQRQTLDAEKKIAGVIAKTKTQIGVK
ncbi:hypothetical protein [Cohnella yongneupensis]|uniref:DUF5667 domain-containing protein n=1 Tax=Cohnella yongneupensis TaxID=425006 RepID=A0ABW0QYN0_9BACL